MGREHWRCGCCGDHFPVEVRGLVPSAAELYAVDWIPLLGKIYCGRCSLRVVAVHVEEVVMACR